MIEFDLFSSLQHIPEWLDDTKEKVVVQSAKASINKLLKSSAVLSVKRIGMSYKLKPSGLGKKDVKRMMRVTKAKGKTIASLEGLITYNTTPIALLKFVTGSKELLSQKGIKIRKRRKLKAEIRPGQKLRIKKAFIQKAKSKQVFKSTKGGGFKRQAVPSIGLVIMRTEHKKALLTHISRRFPRLMANQITFRQQRVDQKLTKRKLKKL